MCTKPIICRSLRGWHRRARNGCSRRRFCPSSTGNTVPFNISNKAFHDSGPPTGNTCGILIFGSVVQVCFVTYSFSLSVSPHRHLLVIYYQVITYQGTNR
ncbi:hypothetical protein OG21DRAFT_1278928 [Imleria badia]|nr:hypothetical protein OG21DRAFT_1278928 [Imleria badia]